MSKTMVHHNADCIKCGALGLEMRRVGAIVFCEKCCEAEFSTDNPPKMEREKYRKWLTVQNEKWNEE